MGNKNSIRTSEVLWCVCTIDKANNHFLIFHVPFFLTNSCIDTWYNKKCLCYYGHILLFFIQEKDFPGYFYAQFFPFNTVSGEKA